MFEMNVVRLVQNKECTGVLYNSDEMLKLKKVFVKILAPAIIETYLNMFSAVVIDNNKFMIMLFPQLKIQQTVMFINSIL